MAKLHGQDCMWRSTARGSPGLFTIATCTRAARLGSGSHTCASIRLRPGAAFRGLSLAGLGGLKHSNSSRHGEFERIGGGVAVASAVRAPAPAVADQLDPQELSGFSRSGEAPAEENPKPIGESVAQFLRVVGKFVRPDPSVGGMILATAVVGRAIRDHPYLLDWSQLHKLVLGLVAVAACVSYSTAINQIYDIDIDKVNKPHLPLASGELTKPAAWAVSLGFAGVGLAIVSTQFGAVVTWLYALGLLMGTLYSVPPLRFKNHSATAFLSIGFSRSFMSVGPYYAALGAQYFQWTPSLLLAIGSVFVFAGAMGVIKDSPDVEGDRMYGITTFASVLGVRTVSLLGSGLVLANHAAQIAASLLVPQAFNPHVIIPAHLVLASVLGVYVWWLDADANYSKHALEDFYSFLWKLYYVECALLPFI